MPSLQDDHDDCQNEQRYQGCGRPVLVKVVGNVVAVQPPGGVVQDDRLAVGIVEFGDSAVQALDSRAPLWCANRARPEIHRKHGRGLHLQIGIRGLLQHVTPHVGIVQQGIHLAGAQCFHAFVHGFVHGDFDVGIQLLDRLGPAAQRAEHTHADALQDRNVPVADGHKRKRRLDEIIRDDACKPGSALDCAAKGHDDIVIRVIKGILQRGLSHKAKRWVVVRVFCGEAHQVHTYARGLTRGGIRVEDGAAIGGHAHNQALLRARSRCGKRRHNRERHRDKRA